MRGAVETVLADAVLFVVLVRDRIHVRILWKRLEKRGVKHGDHRRFGHQGTTCIDTSKCSFVMERCKLCQIVDLGNYIVIDERGLFEELATMNDAMANSRNIVHVFNDGIGTRTQDVQDHTHSSGMVWQRQFVHEFVFINAVLMEGLLAANALAQALR